MAMKFFSHELKDSFFSSVCLYFQNMNLLENKGCCWGEEEIIQSFFLFSLCGLRHYFAVVLLWGGRSS